MRLAYFSPLNPRRTGIADYSEELLPHLAKHAEIDLYVNGYHPSNQEVVARFPIYDWREFEKRRRSYDFVIYQMGNSIYHEYIYYTLIRYPGLTVLHDYILHHFIRAITFERGNLAGYTREMGYCYGLEGVRLAQSLKRQHSRFAFEYPLNNRVIDSSLGIIIHSDYAKGRLEKEHPSAQVKKICHPSLNPPKGFVPKRREELGLESNHFIISSFGLITPEKKIELVLRAFARFRRRFPNSTYLLVGELPSWYSEIEPLIRELHLEDAVILTGYVDINTFYEYIAVTDLCMNLRYPSLGETSGSLLRVMSMGKPAIVSNIGWFAELPDECCTKLEMDGREEDSLLELMEFFALNKDKGEKLGEEACIYVRENHNPAKVAKGYISFIEEILS
jgi:glycosyltransferase involved in cell wall biosynthesis